MSILVPTFNGEAFLDEALRSALGQSYDNVEVLVGDDASTDGTAALLARYAEADPRVKVLRHADNVGAYENPRQLLAAARGEYVKFLLHDDLLHPDCVAELLDGLLSNPSVTLAFSRRTPVDERGAEVAADGFAPLARTAAVIGGRELGDSMLEGCRNAVGELTTVLFRRADVDPRELWQVHGRRLAGLGDLALWLDLLARGDAFYTPRVLSHFRLHRTQRSRDVRILAGSVRDWPLVIDWARSLGFLPEQAQERRAHASVLQLAAAVHASSIDSPDSVLALEATYLSTARLVELAAPLPTERHDEPGDDRDGAMPVRLHGARMRDRFRQDLDVLVRRYTGAVAAPAADAAEVRATMDAFRDLSRSGQAGHFVLGAVREDVDRLVPLVEEALEQGADIDVDLVVTTDPGTLVGETWLAVSPRGGGQWHAGSALSVLRFEPPARTCG